MQQNNPVSPVMKPPIVYGSPIANQLAGNNSIIRPNDSLAYTFLTANSGPSIFPSLNFQSPQSPQSPQQSSVVDDIAKYYRYLCLFFPPACAQFLATPPAEKYGKLGFGSILRDSIIGLLAILLIGLAVWSLVK